MPPRKPKRFRIERVSGILNSKDRSETLETVTRAFVNFQGIERHMLNGLWRKPVYDPEHTRVTVAEGRVTATVVIAPRTIRFGPALVPAMTVGPVATHDHFRKRGYVTAAMNDASRYMQENGILVAYLQGIPDFYYRFGYYPFMAPSRATVKRDEAKKEASPGRLRPAGRRDLPTLKRLYARGNASRMCSAVRDNTVWEWLAGPGGRTWMFASPRLILDSKGRICGYLTLTPKDDELNVRELVVKPQEYAFRAALGALVRESKKREVKSLSLPLPLDDPFAVFLRHFVRTEFRLHMNPTGGALMKIIHFPRLMKALEPMLTERWKSNPPPTPPAEFTLKSDAGSVGVHAGPSGVKVTGPLKGARVTVPQRWLSGLLTGYHTMPEIIDRKGAACPRKLRPVMDVLFPHCCPFVHQGDNY